ncbi:ankyrin repeat-containing domain protein [Phaeosphaeriaceae sp. PMI808]|nr:ankyrin repeat-containing domain protein [Phaeosphaeriaceae sp. PMI808]
MGLLETNTTARDDWMCLAWAAENGNGTIMEDLIASGKVNANWKDQSGRTPLWWAAQNGHEAAVKLLLGTGKVDVNSKDQFGRTPLSWAAENGHEALVKLLQSYSHLS